MSSHHHGHGHAHSSGLGHAHGLGHHHAGTDAASVRALTWALILNGGFLAVELVLGFLTGSLALLSDAAHMVSDVAALLLALGAARLAGRAADALRTFGWRRAEVLGAFVNGLALVGACVVIFWESGERLLLGAPEVDPLPVLIGGSLGLAINLGSAWFLVRAGSDNLNVRGALLHMLADALGSVGAIVAAIGLWAGFPVADPLAGLLIGLLVLYGAVALLREASGVLLQFTPPGTDSAALQTALLELEHVRAVHDVHLWSLDGQQPILTAHLVLSEEALARGVNPFELQARAHALLAERFGVAHCTLQLEAGDGCRGCTLHAPAVPTEPAHGHAGHEHADHDHPAHDHGSHDHGHSHVP